MAEALFLRASSVGDLRQGEALLQLSRPTGWEIPYFLALRELNDPEGDMAVAQDAAAKASCKADALESDRDTLVALRAICAILERHSPPGPGFALAPGQVKDELVYRVEFPERPGALLRFLSGLGQRWNISMFHYRNHGAAYGRILVGVQVEKSERRAFERVLDQINFRYWEETDNRAYQLYLGQRQD